MTNTTKLVHDINEAVEVKEMKVVRVEVMPNTPQSDEYGFEFNLVSGLRFRIMETNGGIVDVQVHDSTEKTERVVNELAVLDDIFAIHNVFV